MKILESILRVTEARVDFGEIQRSIYKIVIKNMVFDDHTKQDLLYLSRETDQFWTSEFDEVLYAIERGYDQDSILDAISAACAEVGYNIIDYLKDPMNFAPGYTPPPIVPFDADSIPEEELLSVIPKDL